MNTEQITQLILQLAPYAMTIISVVGVVIKVISEFKKLKLQVVDMKELGEVKNLLRDLANENYELKRTLNETLTKIDKVERK